MKRSNGYAAALGRMYAQIPKAVLAAIAVSALTCGGDRLEDAQQLIADEWRALFDNEIVPQKPIGEAAKIGRSIDEKLDAEDREEDIRIAWRGLTGMPLK